jgi:Fuseless
MKTKIRLAFCQPLVHTFDVIFSSVVVTPLVVAYWVTVWKLGDIFITPKRVMLSSAISFAIGFGGQFVLMFWQAPLEKLLNFKTRRCLVNVFVSRCFAFVFALTNIHLWRAVWMFADYISTEDNVSIASNVVRNLMIVALSKTLKNSISSPFVVQTDGGDDQYKVTTYFGRIVSSNKPSADVCSTDEVFALFSRESRWSLDLPLRLSCDIWRPFDISVPMARLVGAHRFESHPRRHIVVGSRFTCTRLGFD